MRDGSTNFPQKRAGPTQHIKQDLGHPFQVGETYANRNGNYEVLEIAPPKMTVRYEDGGLLVADIAILARIWDNLQLPEELPESEPRRRAAARPSAQPSAASKPSTQPRAASKPSTQSRAASKPSTQSRAPRQPRTPRD